jgi:carotenoid cleavage dioxygenase-like enzyme
MTSYYEPQEPLDDFMTNFTKFWSNQEQTVESLGLEGINDDYVLPKWLDGEFLISGPSKFYMGNMKVNTALDGFGRYNRFQIKDGDITFNSKLMNSTWYTECEKANKILPGMTFLHTTPERWESKIPFVNLYYSTEYYDNDWVQPNRLPDGKTYVGMTDMASMLEIDIETLTTTGNLKWEDDLPCQTGGTHVQYGNEGEMYALLGDVNPTGDNHLILYKILPENVHKRIAVATVSTGKTPLYEHSIGFDGEYATIFAHPVSFNMMKQVAGYPLTECLTFDKTVNTKIHVVNIKDGSVKTADTGFNFQMMHTGNQYIKDNKIIIDATIYTIDLMSLISLQTHKARLKMMVFF